MNRFRIEVKSLTEEGTFEGLLSVYNVVDDGGDIVEPGAFTKTLQERGNVVPLLWQHKTDTPIGKLTLTDTPEALAVKGELLMELPEAQKAYALIKAQIVKGLSIGYETVKKEMDGMTRRLKELKLFEGSLVTFPMNEMSLVTAVKRRAGGVERKDSFDEELSEIQLRAASYQMRCALDESLGSILWDSDLASADKLTAAEETIRQFHDAYMGFLPDLLKLMEEYYGPSGKAAGKRETKEGRTISSATAAHMMTAHEHMKSAQTCIKSAADVLQALLDGEAGDATSETEAANKSEPVNHSASLSLIEEMKGLINGTRN